MNKEKPIIFSTDMVKAIFESRKSQTRRVIKHQPPENYKILGRIMSSTDPRIEECACWVSIEGYSSHYCKIPYEVGDALWVRETWSDLPEHYYLYKADFPMIWDDDGEKVELKEKEVKWRPSIYMPRDAARLFLKIEAIRVERLQDITVEDAIAEGIPNDWPMDNVYCPKCKGEGLIGSLHPISLGYMEIDCPHCENSIYRFKNLWDSINAKRGHGWDSNPWVWVVEFERITELPEKEKSK